MHNEKERPTEYFPDGTPIDDWFYDIGMPELEELGRPYVLTEYGIWDDGKVYTKEIQKVIDLAAEEGGGVRPHFQPQQSRCPLDLNPAHDDIAVMY